VLCTDRLIKNKNHEWGTFEYAQRRTADIHEEKTSQLTSSKDKEVLWMQRSITKIIQKKIEHTFREDVQEVF
jgi:hypothetical protein